MSNAVLNDPGAVKGGVRTILRLENLAVLVAAITAYFTLGLNPWLFVILFFAPDISFTGFAINARTGAIFYNALHSYVLPIALGALGLLLHVEVLWQIALIITAHDAFDRTLGYGLKYTSAFSNTHLGFVGKRH